MDFVLIFVLLLLGLGYLIGHFVCKLFEIEQEKMSISILSSAVCTLSLLWGFRLSLAVDNFMRRSFSGTVIYEYRAEIVMLLFALTSAVVISLCTALIVKKLYKRK